MCQDITVLLINDWWGFLFLIYGFVGISNGEKSNCPEVATQIIVYPIA